MATPSHQRLVDLGLFAVALADRRVRAVKRRVALHSMPDVDDNILALVRSHPSDVELTILADDPRATRSRLDRLSIGDRAPKVVAKRSLRGIWHFLRSATSIGTHGLYGAAPRGRGKNAIGIWH